MILKSIASESFKAHEQGKRMPATASPMPKLLFGRTNHHNCVPIPVVDRATPITIFLVNASGMAYHIKDRKNNGFLPKCPEMLLPTF